MADDDDRAVAGGKVVRGRRHAARHLSNPYARAAPAPAPAPSADDKVASDGPGAAGELPPGRRWIPRLGGAVGWLWGWWHRRREDEPANDDVNSRHGATSGADDQQHDEQLDRADGDLGVEVGAERMQEDQQDAAQPADPAVELVNILQAQKITRQQYEDCLRVLRGKFTADEPKQNGYDERVALSPGTAGRPDQPDTARFSGEWRTPATHQRDSTALEQLPTFQSAFRREPFQRFSATMPEYKAELAGSAVQEDSHERIAVPGRVGMPQPRLSHAAEPAQHAAFDEGRDYGYGAGPSTDAHDPERQPRPAADGPIPYRYGGSGYYRGYSQSRYGPSAGAVASGIYAQRYGTPYTRLRPSPYMRAPSQTAPPVHLSAAPAEQPVELPPESSTGRGTTRWTPLRTQNAAPMRHKRSHETLTLADAEQGGPSRRQRRDHVEESLSHQRKQGSPSVTTETARRILQTLDQLSSPMDMRKSLNAASTPPRQALDLAAKIPRTTSTTQPSPPPTESLTPANKVFPKRPVGDRAEQGSAPSVAASAQSPAPSSTPSPAPKPAFSFGLKPSKPSGNVFSRLSPNRSPEQPVAKAISREDKQKPGTSEATWLTTSAKSAPASEDTAPVFAGFNPLQPTNYPATPMFSMSGRPTPSSAPAYAIDKDATAPYFSFSEPAPVEPVASNDAKAAASDLADKVPVPTFTFASPDSSLKHREFSQEDKVPALANGGTPAIADAALPARPLFSFANAAPTDATKDALKPATPFGALSAMQVGATQASARAPPFTLPSTTAPTASVFSATASLPATGLLDFLKSAAAEKDAPDDEKTPAMRSQTAGNAADGVTAMTPSVKPAFGDSVAPAFTFGQALKPVESIHPTPTTGFGFLSQAAASSPAVQALPPPEKKPVTASLFTFGTSAAPASTSAVAAATSAPVLFGTTSAPLFSSAPETPYKFGGASTAAANTSGTGSATSFTGFTFGGAPASSAAEPQLLSFGAKPTLDQVASTPAPSQFGSATGSGQTTGLFTPISHQDSQPISEEMGDAAPMGMSPSSPMGTPLASVQTPPVFGLPSAATPFPFGSSSASAFGGSTPAFTAPAFGSSTQTFGAFGSSATIPAFGGSTPAFGGSAGAFASSAGFGSAPGFGGSTPGFGDAASSAPLFGAGSSTPVFGASSTPALGATSAPSFGFGSAPAFNAAFGASSAAGLAPAFGAPPSSPVVFGAPPGTPVAQSGAFPSVGAQTPPPQQSQGGFVFNAGANTPAPGGRVVRKAKRPAGAKRK